MNTEVEFNFSTKEALAETLVSARNPDATPRARLAEAVMALSFASNLSDAAGLESGFRAVNSLRFSPGINRFDLHRADVIYFASIGSRDDAIASAILLAEESRCVSDIQLACKGLRNAAEVCCHYGQRSVAQSYIHESRLIAAELLYPSQVVRADVALADLCLHEMDIEGASAYLEDAERLLLKHQIILRSSKPISTCTGVGRHWREVISRMGRERHGS
jgi:hypothetical protein